MALCGGVCCCRLLVQKMVSLSAGELLAIAVQSYLIEERRRRFSVHPFNSVRLRQGQDHTIMGCFELEPKLCATSIASIHNFDFTSLLL